MRLKALFKSKSCRAYLFCIISYVPLSRKQSAILEYALIGVLVAMAVTKGDNFMKKKRPKPKLITKPLHLVIVTTDDLIKHRCKAYQYLIP